MSGSTVSGVVDETEVFRLLYNTAVPQPGAFKRFPDRYDIASFILRRGSLAAPYEAVYRALCDLQDRFTLGGLDEESRAMQAVIEDYCEIYGVVEGTVESPMTRSPP